MYDSDDYEEPYVTLSFGEWRRNYRPNPKPTPAQFSKQTGRRLLDPYEQLSLVNLALQQDRNIRHEYDQKAVYVATAHDFEEKHGWRLKSVRSELLDLERKWRSGTGHGFSTHLTCAISRWSREMDLHRARKAEEMAERRIEREILGWDRDAMVRWKVQPVQPPQAATFTWKRAYIAGFLLAYGWMIIVLCTRSGDTKPVKLLNG